MAYEGEEEKSAYLTGNEVRDLEAEIAEAVEGLLARPMTDAVDGVTVSDEVGVIVSAHHDIVAHFKEGAREEFQKWKASNDDVHNLRISLREALKTAEVAREEGKEFAERLLKVIETVAKSKGQAK